MIREQINSLSPISQHCIFICSPMQSDKGLDELVRLDFAQKEWSCHTGRSNGDQTSLYHFERWHRLRMCSSMHLDNGLDANVRSDWINRARLSHGTSIR